ncbi:MAG: carbamoyltransferase HypF [Ruminococcus sp.]|jgi:hydrogenase maturation protein HypF|nr:carbamoyltransferase HypF [Ruminococcus sp.]
MKKIIVNSISQGIGFRPYVYNLAKKLGLTGYVRNCGSFAEIVIDENMHDFKILESASGKVRNIPPDFPICKDCLNELFDPDNRRYNYPLITCAKCGPRYTIIKKLPYDRINTSMADFVMCEDCLAEYTDPSSRRFHAQTISCPNCGPALNMEISQAIYYLKNGEILAIKGIGGYHLACIPESEEKLRKLKGRETKPFAVMHFDGYTSDIVIEENLGRFSPYTGIQAMILAEVSPLIMTSANISSDPIIFDDEKIKQLGIKVLTHNRKILRPAEDSVIMSLQKKSPDLPKNLVTRLGRGYANLIIQSKNKPKKNVLALGGDLKNTFCLGIDGDYILSPYIGDLENFDTFALYKRTIEDFLKLYDFKPEYVACDMHPNYFSSRFAETFGLPILRVQHHKAHIYSVMAEHEIEKTVIGVAFDGTGYGEDGNIWGGEFFVGKRGKLERVFHLKYTDILGTDEMMKDAAKLSEFYTKSGLYTNVKTSSMGRLFDVAAALSGVCGFNTYEGECAIMLERSDKPVAEIFHNLVCRFILENCVKIREKFFVNTVCLSGGCFQNGKILVRSVELLKRAGFEVFWNEKVPINDSGISVGQAIV